jgi:hypothetical protein
MNFAFDLDGTLTREPVALKCIMIALRHSGQRVIVLTAVEGGEANRPNRLAMLAQHGYHQDLHWDDLVCVVTGDDKGNYCAANGVVCMFEDDGNYVASIRRISPATACWLVKT